MLDRALELVIPSGSTRDMNDSDLDGLMKTYSIVEIAKDDFLAQKISFQEYIDLLETAQVNIDGYLETVEGNLEEMRLT
ncbi:hypothetical protein [Pleurocapsa sp. FMAR1]|uniref:hypothetical protein n=1 Tax=Pleurocapsa sp. FMAR1 TaxID=3040204 RepID=UPI0029C86B3F|nr:hypothetical protein [Pleurocapsa sp. FMAR1]